MILDYFYDYELLSKRDICVLAYDPRRVANVGSGSIC